MRKYFVTGLVILLPLALTVSILFFLFNLLTNPFVGIVESILDYYDLLETRFLFLSAHQVQEYASKVLILLLLFFFTVALGMLTRWFFIHYILRLWDYLLNCIPVISPVYKTCQEIINTVFASKATSFKQVVLVRYPNEYSYSIGFITREDFPGLNTPLISVFVPTTPNPTSGFLMMFKPSDLIYLDMKVEDAFKYIISCGMILNTFNVISKEDAQSRLESKKIRL